MGPASQRLETLFKMAQAGMDMARINFSHGDYQQHQFFIHAIRALNKKYNWDIRILQDLEGYRIRIGQLPKTLELKKNQVIWLSMDKCISGEDIPLEANVAIRSLDKGMRVYIDDGKICLKVIGLKGKRLKLVVEQGGHLKSRKGVNIPEASMITNRLTEKDQRDIALGLKHRIDGMALSFVRTPKDILRVVQLVKPRLPQCLIIAKIENQQGVQNIDGILDACDGIMVARGDLGVSLPIYQIPFIQKDLIRRAIRKKKIAITATQMLESMTDAARPTRAEVSDVANAILDGTDYVMLSGETAAGHYPVKCVRMMLEIIEFTEKSMMYLK